MGLLMGHLPLREVGLGVCLGGPVPGPRPPVKGVWTPQGFLLLLLETVDVDVDVDVEAVLLSLL